MRLDVAILCKRRFSALIIDEAQAIKNATSQTSKALKQLAQRVPIRLALTGTPVENRLTELHSIFDFALSGWLGPQKLFIEHFSKVSTALP